MIKENDEFVSLAFRMLRRDEDLRSYPYDDVTGKTIALPTGGKITIGIGRNLTDRGLSDEEIYFLFNNDLQIAIDIVQFIFFEEYPTFSLNRRIALAGLAFNLGQSSLLTFKNTIRAIRKSDWTAAARSLEQSLWFRQVKGRGPRIVSMIEKDIYAYT